MRWGWDGGCRPQTGRQQVGANGHVHVNTLAVTVGRTDERRLERELLADYEATLAALLPRLSTATLPDATQLLELPASVRGYGHVKLRSIVTYKVQRDALKLSLGIS